MNITKLVCLGDSLTEGYGIETHHRWSDLLKKEFPFEIINRGISGDTTAGMLARFQYDVIAHQPSHVIIMGGTNDLWQSIPDEQILSNIRTMTRHARHHNFEAIIGLPTPFFYADPGMMSLEDAEWFEERLNIFRKKLQTFAENDDRHFIDFAKNMKPELFLMDGLHPNEAGNEVMMENVKTMLFM